MKGAVGDVTIGNAKSTVLPDEETGGTAVSGTAWPHFLHRRGWSELRVVSLRHRELVDAFIDSLAWSVEENGGWDDSGTDDCGSGNYGCDEDFDAAGD